jgi:predicted acetyltransferase
MFEDMTFCPPGDVDLESFWQYINEFNKQGNSKYSSIKSFEAARFFLSALDLAKVGIGLKPGYVPSETYFVCINKNLIVGRIDLRKDLNESLMIEGGHIGYEIRPSERQKGIGKSAVKAFLGSGLVELPRVLITCFEHNIASEKIALSVGGTYEDTRTSPRTGERTKRFWVDTARCQPNTKSDYYLG